MKQTLFRPALIYSRRLQPNTRPALALGSKPAAIRQAILSRSASTSTSTGGSKVLNFLYGATIVLGFGIIYVYVTDTRAGVHKYVVVPVLRWVYRDPESAHQVGNFGLKSLWQLGLYPRERGDPDRQGDLQIEVFGHLLRNPIGTSAGIDKHAEIPDPLMAIGPAIVEIGGTTPLPQPGNDKPRVFRISSQNAMINRYGLNSEGADHVATRLRYRVREYAFEHGLGHDAEAESLVLNGAAGVPPGSLTNGKLLAINIAKNKSTPESDIQAVSDDYVYCVQKLGPYADILVVNVSSPNTPGLRSLQKGDNLKHILSAVVGAANSIDRSTKPVVMVKVSPDEDSDEQVLGIAQAVWESGVDGVIVGNTTNQRPAALSHLRGYSTIEQQHLLEQGGFSGPHLFERTVGLVKKYKKLLDDRSQPTTPEKSGSIDAVTSSVETGIVSVRNLSDTPDAYKKLLLNVPTNKFYGQPAGEQNKLTASPTSSHPVSTKDQSSVKSNPFAGESKVIFATGGITNGKQALEVLNAGASVAMVYTALVYGGVGTISRIKDEMRQEMRRQATERESKKSTRKV